MATLLGAVGPARSFEESRIVGPETMRRWVRAFIVKSAINDDDLRDVCDKTGVHIGDSHPDDNDARCISRSAKPRSDEPTIWDVTCTYIAFEVPATVVRWDIERHEKAVQSCYASQNSTSRDSTICTSAGELYDPPITIPTWRPTLTVTRVEEIYQPLLSKFAGGCNNNQMTIFGNIQIPRGVMLFAGNSAEQQIISGRERWRTTYKFLFELNDNFGTGLEGWMSHVLDYGTWFFLTDRDKVAGKRTRFRDQHGGLVKGRLDGLGHPLGVPTQDSSGNVLRVVDDGTKPSVFRHFLSYPVYDFATLFPFLIS